MCASVWRACTDTVLMVHAKKGETVAGTILLYIVSHFYWCFEKIHFINNPNGKSFFPFLIRKLSCGIYQVCGFAAFLYAKERIWRGTQKLTSNESWLNCGCVRVLSFSSKVVNVCFAFIYTASQTIYPINETFYIFCPSRNLWRLKIFFRLLQI